MILLRPVFSWISKRSVLIKAIGAVASTNLLGTIIGIIGTLVQAHFISPEELGFLRKYSVISGYAIFLNLGLFTILRREYPVLIGEGEKKRAQQATAIVQSWTLLVLAVVCGSLSIVVIIQFIQGQWKAALALLVQIVTIFAVLYQGQISATFRTADDFRRAANGNFISTLATLVVLPLFLFWPFLTLVVRSIIRPIIGTIYWHKVRPEKVGWYLPWGEFCNLTKRGLRLYAGSYLRYNFWPTMEIWLMLHFGGDSGVGLLSFSVMFTQISSQLSYAVNQIFVPQIAEDFGRTGNLALCFRRSIKPSLLNVGFSIPVILFVWVFLPTILKNILPNYYDSMPLIRVLILQMLIVSFSLPTEIISIMESYITQLAAAIFGLIAFVLTVYMLYSLDFGITSIAWGTLVGQVMFVVVCLVSLLTKLRAEKQQFFSLE